MLALRMSLLALRMSLLALRMSMLALRMSLFFFSVFIYKPKPTNLAARSRAQHSLYGCVKNLKESDTSSQHLSFPLIRYYFTSRPATLDEPNGTFSLQPCVNLKGVRCTCLTPPHPAGTHHESKPNRFVWLDIHTHTPDLANVYSSY